MSDVERSLQIRYSQEDAVWIAAAVLLYEKYYCNPGINSDDILLMQYEVQTRSQKVYGPVSYTHLDVYKRQLWLMSIIGKITLLKNLS